MEFYLTGYGKHFFEVQLPRLVKALERIAAELEKRNDKDSLDPTKGNKT